MLTGGQVHDSKAAVDVLSEIDISGSNILGDKAYGTEEIRTYITEQNAKYTIPPRENISDPWYCDYWLYKERHLVECFFNKSKLFAELLLVMISLLRLFLLSYTLLPFGFCLNDTTLLSFQIRSSIRLLFDFYDKNMTFTSRVLKSAKKYV